MLKRMTLGLPIFLLVIIIVSIAMLAVDAAEWTMYRGPDHTGISKETGWFDASAGMKLIWEQKIGNGFGSIAIGAGRAYAMGNDGGKETIYCFEAKSGKKIWSFSHEARLFVPKEPKLHVGGPGSTPTIDGENVYAVSKHGIVRCFSADKGEVKWTTPIKSKNPQWGFAASPLVVGDLLILNAGSAGTAFNKKTGKLAWSSGPGYGGYATPIPLQRDGKPHVLLFVKQSVIIVNAADGKKVWEFPWKTKYDISASDPIIAGENLFISSGLGTGCCLVPLGNDAPKPIWKNKNLKTKLSGGVLYKGCIYAFDEKKLTCLDLKTGQAKWAESSLGMGVLILSDGKLILVSEKGKLVIADASPEGYKELASSEILKSGKRCWATPAISDGLIYARNAIGELVCVKVGK